jgi:hypothetical protein
MRREEKLLIFCKNAVFWSGLLSPDLNPAEN